MRLEDFQALISGWSPIRIYRSLTSCWHTLNKSHKIFRRHGIPCLLHDLAKSIYSTLLFAAYVRMMTLYVVLHPIPNGFNRVKIRRVGRPENRLGEPLEHFFYRTCCCSNKTIVLHYGKPRSHRAHR